MLTQLIIRNFKLFDEVAIELGERVVFVGPNNSGKTSALQVRIPTIVSAKIGAS
jgi:predicted ATP-dependent endonuclease of OLD family